MKGLDQFVLAVLVQQHTCQWSAAVRRSDFTTAAQNGFAKLLDVQLEEPCPPVGGEILALSLTGAVSSSGEAPQGFAPEAIPARSL